MTWPPDDDHAINEDEWRFMADGRLLVDALQDELGDAVEVRFGLEHA
jgi:hypothetical protein